MIANAIALLVIVREEVVGALSPRVFGIIGLLLMVTGFAFLTVRFRAINRKYQPEELVLDPSDPTTRKKIVWRVRQFQAMVIIMPLFLLYGLLTRDGEPLLALTAGIAVNLGITWLFLKALRAEKTKLRRLVIEPLANKSQQQTTMKVDKA
jgi:hypothetical protein